MDELIEIGQAHYLHNIFVCTMNKQCAIQHSKRMVMHHVENKPNSYFVYIFKPKNMISFTTILHHPWKKNAESVVKTRKHICTDKV